MLYCIDPWQRQEIEDVFDQNIAEHPEGDKCRKIKAYSALTIPRIRAGSMNVVYVDGNHEGMHVMQDMAMAWVALAVDGLMIMDDYGLVKKSGWRYEPPRVAIDAFLRLWAHRIDVVYIGYQVIVRKVR